MSGGVPLVHATSTPSKFGSDWMMGRTPDRHKAQPVEYFMQTDEYLMSDGTKMTSEQWYQMNVANPVWVYEYPPPKPPRTEDVIARLAAIAKARVV